MCVNNTSKLFIEEIARIFDECCLRLVKRQNNNRAHKPQRLNNWFTPYLNSIRIMLLMFKDRSHNSNEYKEMYIRIRKICRSEISLGKCRVNDNYILKSRNSCKAAWEVIKSEINRPTTQLAIPIAPDILNSHFNFSLQQDLSPLNAMLDAKTLLGSNKYVVHKFCWATVTENDVSKAIGKLSSSRAEDFYGLSNYVIKNISSDLLPSLTTLINHILQQGIFPDCLKIAVTIPIFKKGDKSNPSNYHPISLIPIISKIIEDCVHQQMNHYFERNNLLSISQYGFRSKLSTVKAVENIVSDIYMMALKIN
ncbi:uncharacterized protein LOC126426817 isoform X6 [Schistocerca serialis cubense]|uniref:uncharacterized protein LOC126426817 isoform X6 n=1 Tax=Schistocerca serialis cubense TaxID=2023355 RepID=UPI00214F427F|nr:uncharacterized protein LOC126426817 isoform X6 [Schistocerca serialis cubense]